MCKRDKLIQLYHNTCFFEVVVGVCDGSPQGLDSDPASATSCFFVPNNQNAFINSYQKVFFLEYNGRGGVGQMLTKADEGGRGGQANADHC